MINTEQNKKYETPGKFVIISGPAGSGKGTVLKELFILNDYKYSVSATTRTPRDGEAEGVNYYFISREDFAEKISEGDMLEYVEYAGNYYGTPKEPVEKMIKAGYNVVLEIEVEGAMNVKKQFPQAIMIFIIPPNYSELEKRLKGRATESEEVIKNRLEISKREINCAVKYDYLVINNTDKQKETAFIINCIVEAEKYKNIDEPSNISDISDIFNISDEIKTILETAEAHKINTQKTEKFLHNYFNKYN